MTRNVLFEHLHVNLWENHSFTKKKIFTLKPKQWKDKIKI